MPINSNDPVFDTEAEVRAHRNSLLAASDFRFTSDQNPSDEWHVYRAVLRNIPQGDTWPNSFIWPPLPSA